MAQRRTSNTYTLNEYDIVTRHDLLSQTPPNYSKDNFYLKELQDKVDAEWNWRPNRADIKYEKEWGEQVYDDIQVVLDSVIGEKGVPISSDRRCIIFRNIFENRFTTGSRFKFAIDLNPENEYQDTWLTVNHNISKFTASVDVQRCNGTLVSLYVDPDTGISRPHTEPVVQGVDLTGVSFRYNETIVSPQSQLVIHCQHNKYTKQYFMNQRFIVGYDRVYKLKGINKFNGNSTENPENIGVMTLYLEITEQSAYDDMEKRIAYQQEQKVILDETPKDSVYTLTFDNYIPNSLTDELVEFVPVVMDENGEKVTGCTFNTSIELENLSSTASIDRYIDFTQTENGFSIQRKRIYISGDLVVTCVATIPGVSEPLTTSFKLVVRERA